MNRREFLESALASVAVLALPSAALAKPAIDHSLFGQHLSEFDENNAIISTVQRAFGTLWYGNCKPELIMSPYRMVGRMWYGMKRSQWEFVECDRSRFNRGLKFCGATWFGNDALTDEVVFINSRYDKISAPDVWAKFNGWYRASKIILEDPFGDECFERMLRS